jgi:hypothetical protein
MMCLEESTFLRAYMRSDLDKNKQNKLLEERRSKLALATTKLVQDLVQLASLLLLVFEE